MPKHKTTVRKRRKARKKKTSVVVERKRTNLIKSYIKKGYSANKIQKILKQRHLGIRRKVLLRKIREIKKVRPKRKREKYIPRKYRKGIAKRIIIEKQVAVYGIAHTTRYVRGYSARFEFYGKNLQRAVIMVKQGFVPYREHPFVKCNARSFLRNPNRFGEEGWWSNEYVTS